MAIRLLVENYCQDCGYFEPDCEIEQIISFGSPDIYDTTIRCKSAGNCSRIYEHLENCIKEEK